MTDETKPKPKRSGPKTPRKKRVTKCPYNARYGASNVLWRLAQTEEGKAELARRRAKGGKGGRKLGTPDGYTHKQMEQLRVQAAQEADELIKIMEEQEILPPTDELLGNDTEIAKEALKETIIILRTPGDMRNKLQAARTLLEYTRAKPASTSNVTVSTAEDFLAALAAKEPK